MSSVSGLMRLRDESQATWRTLPPRLHRHGVCAYMPTPAAGGGRNIHELVN